MIINEEKYFNIIESIFHYRKNNYMRFLTLIFCFFISWTSTFSQKKSVPVEILKLDTLQTKLSGVKYAYFLFSETERKVLLQQLGNIGNTVDFQIISGIIDYFNKDLLISHIVTDEQKKQSFENANSACDYVYFSFSLGAFKSDFMAIGKIPFEFTFTFCDKSEYSFKRIIPVNGLTNYRITFRNVMNNLVNRYIDRKNKWSYNEANKLRMKENPIVIRYKDFMNYLDTNKNLSKYEGLFELAYSDVGTSRQIFGIYNDNGQFKLVYFEGSYFSSDWDDGELKGELKLTKSETDILVKYYDSHKLGTNFLMKFNDTNAFDLYPIDKKEVDRYIRIR